MTRKIIRWDSARTRCIHDVYRLPTSKLSTQLPIPACSDQGSRPKQSKASTTVHIYTKNGARARKSGQLLLTQTCRVAAHRGPTSRRPTASPATCSGGSHHSRCLPPSRPKRRKSAAPPAISSDVSHQSSWFPPSLPESTRPR